MEHRPADVSAVRIAYDTLTGALARWAPGRHVAIGQDADSTDIVVTPLALLCGDATRSVGATSVGIRIRFAVSVAVDDLDGLEVLERLATSATGRVDLAVVAEAALAPWYERGVPRGRVGCVVDVLSRRHHVAERAVAVRQPLDLHLQPLAAVKGRVTSSTGAPLPGVRVDVGRGGTSALTDGDGRFRLSTISPTPTVWVEVEGRQRFPVAAGSGDLEVVVDDG